MRAVLIALGIAMALGATGGLAFVVLRGEPRARPDETEPVVKRPTPADTAAKRSPELPGIRAYETTRTLVEDLRDSLADSDEERAKEFWRVSERLETTAVWTLSTVFRNETSPQVRALAFLAAGVHAQDEAMLLQGLDDPDARVRRATLLAISFDPTSKKPPEVLLGIPVPTGRKLGRHMRERLTVFGEREESASVRETLRSVMTTD
jgi:hypothetical protein